MIRSAGGNNSNAVNFHLGSDLMKQNKHSEHWSFDVAAVGKSDTERICHLISSRARDFDVWPQLHYKLSHFVWGKYIFEFITCLKNMISVMSQNWAMPILHEFWPFFLTGIIRMGVRPWREPIQLETRERICKFTTSVRVWTRLSVICFAVRATSGCIACTGTAACFCHTGQPFNVCGCPWTFYERWCDPHSKNSEANTMVFCTLEGYQDDSGICTSLGNHANYSPLEARPPTCRIPDSAALRARAELLTPLEISCLDDQRNRVN